LPAAGRVPLLTIRYTTPDPDFVPALRQALAVAEQRRPGTGFDVVAVIPRDADPAVQLRAFNEVRGDAVAVMAAMVDDDVTPDRLHLGARIDPAAGSREVRVYLR
jgi:hypothetical protein